MKTARRSFNKEPYNCLKPWPEDCFCQCGGNGVVFTDNSSMSELLTNPKDQQEAIKAVLGEESKKTHYKTAFFEAFPKNPSCFIRGEGKTIEEAEEKAFIKWEKILNCQNHQWDRKGRTDGYCFCTLCPLSGTFLEPLTKCEICLVPTSKYTDKDDKHYCLHHYFELPMEQVVEDKDTLLGYPKAEREYHFLEDQKLFQLVKHFNPTLDQKSWEQCWDLWIKVRAGFEAKVNPLFGPATKSKKEIHEELMSDLPAIAYHLRLKLNLN